MSHRPINKKHLINKGFTSTINSIFTGLILPVIHHLQSEGDRNLAFMQVIHLNLSDIYCILMNIRGYERKDQKSYVISCMSFKVYNFFFQVL